MERKGDSRCRGRSVVGSQTECFSSILHSFFGAGFREARAASRNVRVLPAAPPSYLLSCADEQASASVRRPVRL